MQVRTRLFQGAGRLDRALADGRLWRTLLHKLLNRVLLRVRTFPNAYGEHFKKVVIIPAGTVSTEELRSLPLFGISEHLGAGEYVSPEAYVGVVEDVIYCPVSNVLLTPDRAVIAESLLPHHQFILGQRWVGPAFAKNGLPYWKNFRNSAVEPIPGTCCVFRGIYEAHFHAVVSEIPRLFLLQMFESIPKETIKLLVPDKLTSVETYFLQKVLPENVKPTVIRSDRVYRLEKLVFPSYLNEQSSGYLPHTYLHYLHSVCLPKRRRTQRNRILISRRNYGQSWGKRHILNEDEFYEALRPLGFQRHILEDLPIDEQIELFFDADIVVGAHGSGLTNILFSANAQVIELNPVKAMHPYFYLLSKSVGCSHQVWFGGNADDAVASDEKALFVNFKVDVPAVVAMVLRADHLRSLGSCPPVRAG
jgi:Glycosyltransferase 61